MSESNLKISPMMLQWQQCKEAAGDAILLFRMGDFYEAFHEDAHILSKELDLTLTRRQEIPMSGVPYHTSEGYVDKLVTKGYRVAIAEQLDDPKNCKGLLRRAIVRMVTPGTLISSQLISEKKNNFFACLTKSSGCVGLAFLDLTTSEFFVSEFAEPAEISNQNQLLNSELLNEIYRLQPAEILTSEKFCNNHANLFSEMRQSYHFLLDTQADWCFEGDVTYNFLTQHFQTQNLEGFGLKEKSASVHAAGALLKYLQDNLCLPINQIQTLRVHTSANFMSLDRITMRHLELTTSLRDGSRKNTLIDILDYTQTPMGGRLLYQWIKHPLLDIVEIDQRQNGIVALLKNIETFKALRIELAHVKDLERLLMKITTGFASPRDLNALAHSFAPLDYIKKLFSTLPATWITQEADKIDPLPQMRHKIMEAIVDEPPLRISDGNIFRDGFHRELDELRTISADSKAWIMQYQMRLREETGIKTLKVSFNKLFGYYIEVSRGQSEKMPPIFIRKQTLVNAERYISQDLKDYESKVLTAQERIHAIEHALFEELRQEISGYAKSISNTAQAIACLDCLNGLAEAALQNQYCRPLVDHGNILSIQEGRHPVVEHVCKMEKFVSNDLFLDPQQRLLLITGPNMSGKSTYLRQNALIVIMAHIGSFVPARSAQIGLTDKVFTRIGASDDLARGQSTFMVEMLETAAILNSVTPRSFVILDEIGRGTSTYDGISIAWSVAEYLLTNQHSCAKTLFATHYWELTKLQDNIPGAINYHVAVDETEAQITFLRKIIKGSTDRSYGIHVARLAGMPQSVVERAKEILAHLEENAQRKTAFEPPKKNLLKHTKSKMIRSNATSNTIYSDNQLSLFSAQM